MVSREINVNGRTAASWCASLNRMASL